ncbi:helix-turn-helix transcriptional regulator [soil metagenome]
MKTKRPIHDELKTQALSDPEIKMAYDELEEEFVLIEELIRARKVAHKTQEDIARNMHTTVSAISRIESGGGTKRHSPSLSTLRRYARALGCTLKIKLVPMKQLHDIHGN